MAFTEFYVRTTGSNLNAGSTNVDAPVFGTTAGTWVAATGVYTKAGADLSAVAVGMWASVFIDGATVGVFVGQITAVDDAADTITVSLVRKSGTAPVDGVGNRSINVGGAFAGPAAAVAFPFGFVQATMTNVAADPPRINFAAGTWNVTAAMTHGNAGITVWQGAGPTDTVIDGVIVGASYTVLTFNSSATGNHLVGFGFNNNGTTGSATMVSIAGVGSMLENCVFENSRGFGLTVGATGVLAVKCLAVNCNSSDTAALGGFNVIEESFLVRCHSHLNSTANGHGFVLSVSTGETATFINCIASENGGDGFLCLAGANGILSGCCAVSNGGDGLDMTAITVVATVCCHNCIFSDNAGYGINGDITVGTPNVYNCAFFDNTSGDISIINDGFIFGKITLTADPFIAAAAGNFGLNNVAGGGAAVRGAGVGSFLLYPALFPDPTIGYPDVGAAQHQEAAPVASSGGCPHLPTYSV